MLSSSSNKDCMHIYSADITSAFLETLDHPAIPPPSRTSISVQITTIPYRPYKSLRDRLLALLFPPQHGGLPYAEVCDERAREEKSENSVCSPQS